MEEKNKIYLTKIATILQQIDNGGNSINGSDDVALCSVESLNNLGKKIEKIVEEELKLSKTSVTPPPSQQVKNN